MKIEIGESLLMSWLRHAKGCQLVQTNWKASVNSWDLMNEEVIRKIMSNSDSYFKNKYNYDVYKGNTSIEQLIRQAEIDVIGVSFETGNQYMYAIDVAFHEAGLNYGSKDETIMRVIKKILRTAMCIYGYFGLKEGDIIFASPKINYGVMDGLSICIAETEQLLQDIGLNFKIRLICNEEFGEKILQPVLSATSLISDTSELFMRSLQMYNLFADKKPRKEAIKSNFNNRTDIKAIEVTNIEGLKEMKIGVLVRSTLTRMLENDEISPDEIKLMQTAEYSKKTFGITYPLLIKTALSRGDKVLRYWSGAVEAYGENYFICSEWFEVPANNDRPFFMLWLAQRTKGKIS